MHIPDMMLQGAICPATAALASVGLAGTAYAAYKTKIKPAASFFAGVTALVFAAQMANFPVQLGTSGHLLGAALAVALLGSAFGVMAMSLVVLAQCLVFGDGGISVLGANLLNMALLASIPAVIVREFFAATLFRKTAYFAAAFVSTLIAAAACAVQLGIAGTAPLPSVLSAMLSVHVLIGLAEGGLTVAALVILAYAVTKVAPSRAWIVPLGIAAAIAVLVSPFAATSPDGLESVAGALGFGCTCAHGHCLMHMSPAFICTCAHGNCLVHPLFAAPFAGYAVPAVTSSVLSVALAGFVGVAALFAVAYGTGRILAQKDKK
jgi:cobalt/nickel transport system permease protein